MRYVKISNGFVREIIPEFDAEFTGVDIKERYPKEFLKGLIRVSDDTTVLVGMKYNATENIFEFVKTAEFENGKLEQEQEQEQEPALAQCEINVDFDYRLCCLELGLNN